MESLEDVKGSINNGFEGLKEDIQEIDFLLKDPFLSNDEINELLDRRGELRVMLNGKNLS